jgi:Flp pilus assembly protein TadD
VNSLVRVGLVIAVAVTLAGCQSVTGRGLLEGESSSSSTQYRNDGSRGWSLFGNRQDERDLVLAKRHFRENNFGLAERYYRRAVEAEPSNAEAWVGLGAAYDHLRRFELADRAYDQAMSLIGATPELLNNRGYSYMMRGEHDRARELLLEAQAKDPGNPFVKNNLTLLEST